MGDLNAGLLAGVGGVPGAQNGQLQGGAAAPAQAVLQARPSRYAVDHGVSIEQLAQFDEKQVAQWISTAFPRLGQFAPLFGSLFEVQNIADAVVLVKSTVERVVKTNQTAHK